MNWQELKTSEHLDKLIHESEQVPQVIFKYSSRCSISDVVRNRLEKTNPDSINFHFLDLIRYRSLSNEIAEKFGVEHESPQILLIKNGQCVYDESHLSVNMGDIVKHAA